INSLFGGITAPEARYGILGKLILSTPIVKLSNPTKSETGHGISMLNDRASAIQFCADSAAEINPFNLSMIQFRGCVTISTKDSKIPEILFFIPSKIFETLSEIHCAAFDAVLLIELQIEEILSFIAFHVDDVTVFTSLHPAFISSLSYFFPFL